MEITTLQRVVLQQTTADPVVVLNGLSKVYDLPSGVFYALRNVGFEIGRGEFLAIVGPSGSGKTTLLNVMTGIDTPSAGTVVVDGVEVSGMKQKDLTRWRGKAVGVVFQFFQLLPTLSVLENVILPMDFFGVLQPRERRERAMGLLERFGIADQARKYPAYLSGGQQQRAAIARALANDPPLICADEPTGNLDSRTSDTVFELFVELAAAGKAVVMVTHEKDLGRYATRELTLLDGSILSDRRLR